LYGPALYISKVEDQEYQEDLALSSFWFFNWSSYLARWLVVI